MILKLCIVLIALLASSYATRKLPENFMLGAASAAYQIEGAWNEDGRGPCIWDSYTEEKGLDNGYVAADSYHKWQDDVRNAKLLGLNFYRFSISWSRILPNGTINFINQKGVDYYTNLIKALKAEGIEPIITLYYWDLPQYLQLLGGFLNSRLVEYFEDYVRLCFELYGEYVKYWLTINEPFTICYDGYGSGGNAPGLQQIGDGVYQCAHTVLKMHARAYRVYDEEFRDRFNGQVGLVINSEWREPKSNSSLDLEAQERALQFSVGMYANPVFVGNWPQVMIDRIGNRSAQEGFTRSRLPPFTEDEIAYINGTHDFFALNTYGHYMVEYQDDEPISYPSYDFDRSVKTYNNLIPSGFMLRKKLNYLQERYNPKAILITENGYRTDDILNDADRIKVLKDFLGNILDAVEEDNINVIGYSVWSLIDNFEWGSYKAKFGLIRVDFDDVDRKRTWKDSGYWYQNLTSTRILDD
ncbi:unnamed protein product [Ceutorhynchus assimilis]|uniref:Beta-glucosidase n=1 Tax=Ceutorhynchus assimilis TaxID=467358 RepID=A0A9N9MNX9_9CUCU|nr:unnamed protein product [Ceutorhynchus assimilis]